MKKRQDELCTLFHGAPIAKSFGMSLHYDDAGSAIFTQPYNPNFDHGLGGIHGSVFATMLDNAGWFTVAPHFETWVATVEFSTRILEPVEKEDLVARGEIIRMGKKLTVAQMEIKTGADRLVAVGSGTFTVTSVPYLNETAKEA